MNLHSNMVKFKSGQVEGKRHGDNIYIPIWLNSNRGNKERNHVRNKFTFQYG